MPVGIALGIAGAGLLGDVFSSQGQQSANQANIQQAQQQEQFQQSIFNQETTLENNAVQRRVADLKAAGINPMLAAGSAAGVPGGQPGAMANVGNPNQAFGNLGQIAGNAVQASQQQQQVASNVGLQTAQSNAADAKARSDEADAILKTNTAAKIAGVDTDVGRQNILESQSRIELQRLQGLEAQSNTKLNTAQANLADSRVGEVQASIARLGAAQSADQARAQLDDLASNLKGLEIDQFNRIAPQLLTSATNAAKQSGLDLARVARQANVYQTPYVGAVAGYMDTIANWFHLGANISSSTVSKQ